MLLPDGLEPGRVRVPQPFTQARMRGAQLFGQVRAGLLQHHRIGQLMADTPAFHQGVEGVQPVRDLTLTHRELVDPARQLLVESGQVRVQFPPCGGRVRSAGPVGVLDRLPVGRLKPAAQLAQRDGRVAFPCLLERLLLPDPPLGGGDVLQGSGAGSPSLRYRPPNTS